MSCDSRLGLSEIAGTWHSFKTTPLTDDFPFRLIILNNLETFLCPVAVINIWELNKADFAYYSQRWFSLLFMHGSNFCGYTKKAIHFHEVPLFFCLFVFLTQPHLQALMSTFHVSSSIWICMQDLLVWLIIVVILDQNSIKTEKILDVYLKRDPIFCLLDLSIYLSIF